VGGKISVAASLRDAKQIRRSHLVVSVVPLWFSMPEHPNEPRRHEGYNVEILSCRKHALEPIGVVPAGNRPGAQNRAAACNILSCEKPMPGTILEGTNAGPLIVAKGADG
jgi:hypothetical protein